MAACQYKIQTGTDVRECGRPAAYLCTLRMTWTAKGRVKQHEEYRCEQHKEGVAWKVGA